LVYKIFLAMEKKEYKININAPREKVWDTLWDDASYRAWTAAFAEGSKVETNWEKGSKVYFLDVNGMGMVSMIAENKPNEHMSFKHLGIVKDGVEDYDSEESKKWGDSFENYTLKTVNGGTELVVDLSANAIPAEYEDYFGQAWPKALNKLKELAEA
jgi:uncharacterized protein YndB with AHSA1/START domain